MAGSDPDGEGPEGTRDPGAFLSDFLGCVLVHCPGCDGVAVVRPEAPWEDDAAWEDKVFAPRRLTCTACGHAARWPSGSPSSVTWHRDGRDPHFGQPLWLVRRVAGHVLWAYDRVHLQLLRDWVAADQRGRSDSPARQTMLESLPAWMTSAKHRAAILRAADELLR